MAYRGLAIATSISAIITTGTLLYGLKRKIGSFGFTKSIKCGLKSLVAFIAMEVVVYFLYGIFAKTMGSGTLPELITLLTSAGAGVLVCSIIIYLFRIKNEQIDLNKKTGLKVKEVFGDKAYFRKSILDKIHGIKAKAYIPVSETVYKIDEEQFSYNRDSNEWFCSEGNNTVKRTYGKRKNGRQFINIILEEKNARAAIKMQNV